jgi:neutral trehalase
MKTKEEIKNEILELYGANEALRAIQNMIHAHSMEKMKQMMALNHMLREMDDEDDLLQDVRDLL